MPPRMSRYVLVHRSIAETIQEALSGKASARDGEGATVGDISERGLDIFCHLISVTEANGPGTSEVDKEAEKPKGQVSSTMTQGCSGACFPGEGASRHSVDKRQGNSLNNGLRTLQVLIPGNLTCSLLRQGLCRCIETP